MYIDTSDFASLKEIIFKEGNIESIEDLKDHTNYKNLSYDRFFGVIDNVISSANEEDKAYFVKLKEAFEYCRNYKDTEVTLEKLDGVRAALSRKQSECDRIKTKNMVRSVYRFGRFHQRMVAYDPPMKAMVAYTVYCVILAGVFFLLWLKGSKDMSSLPYPMGFIALLWLYGFLTAALKLKPYEAACDKELEISKKYSELTPKINEFEDKAAAYKREAYMCYRDLNKMGR